MAGRLCEEPCFWSAPCRVPGLTDCGVEESPGIAGRGSHFRVETRFGFVGSSIEIPFDCERFDRIPEGIGLHSTPFVDLGEILVRELIGVGCTAHWVVSDWHNPVPCFVHCASCC